MADPIPMKPVGYVRCDRERPDARLPAADRLHDRVAVHVIQTQVHEHQIAAAARQGVERGANLADLVNGLNALGIGPRDLITILQAIKAAGALQAEIGLM